MLNSNPRRRLLVTGVLILFSLMAIFARPYLPENHLSILKVQPASIALYSDAAWGGMSSVNWKSEPQNFWTCKLVQSQFYPVCGYTLSFLEGDKEDRADQYAHDFSKYRALDLKIKYSGEAPKLRIFLRNHNPAYADINDDDSAKFNFFNISTNNLAEGPVRIKLSEFSVADWWLDERNIPRELAAPELDRIVAVGVDIPAPHVFGNHDIQIEALDLVGELLSETELYFGLLILWLVMALLDVACTLVSLKNDQSKAQKTV